MVSIFDRNEVACLLVENIVVKVFVEAFFEPLNFFLLELLSIPRYRRRAKDI